MRSLTNVCCDAQHIKSEKEYNVAIEDCKLQDNSLHEPGVFLHIFSPQMNHVSPRVVY